MYKTASRKLQKPIKNVLIKRNKVSTHKKTLSKKRLEIKKNMRFKKLPLAEVIESPDTWTKVCRLIHFRKWDGYLYKKVCNPRKMEKGVISSVKLSGIGLSIAERWLKL